MFVFSKKIMQIFQEIWERREATRVYSSSGKSPWVSSTKRHDKPRRISNQFMVHKSSGWFRILRIAERWGCIAKWRILGNDESKNDNLVLY